MCTYSDSLNVEKEFPTDIAVLFYRSVVAWQADRNDWAQVPPSCGEGESHAVKTGVCLLCMWCLLVVLVFSSQQPCEWMAIVPTNPLVYIFLWSCWCVSCVHVCGCCPGGRWGVTGRLQRNSSQCGRAHPSLFPWGWWFMCVYWFFTMTSCPIFFASIDRL